MMSFYISPAGDDGNSGSKGRPFASFEPLSSPGSPLEPGDTVVVRGGTIHSTGITLRELRGTPTAPIAIVGDGETAPVIDCEDSIGPGVQLDSCAGIRIQGLTLRNPGGDGIRIKGNTPGRNHVEGVEVTGYGRQRTGHGIHVTGSTDLHIDGCYLHDGGQERQESENGLRIRAFRGHGVIRATELYRNPGGGAMVLTDRSAPRLLFHRCIAHRNGFEPGGNRRPESAGFDVSGATTLYRCITYHNAGTGFVTGEGTRLVRGTAWANAETGYRVTDGAPDIVRCLAATNQRGPTGGRSTADRTGLIAAEVPGFRSTDDTDPAFLQPRGNSALVQSSDPTSGSDPNPTAEPGARSARDRWRPDDTDPQPGQLARRSRVLRQWRNRAAEDPI